MQIFLFLFDNFAWIRPTANLSPRAVT